MTTDTRIDQEHAYTEPSHIYKGNWKFSQIIKGWSGAGFESRYTSIEGTYLTPRKVSNLMFEIHDTKNGRNYTKHGSIVLTEAQAIKLAMDIMPPEISHRIDAHDDLVELLKRVKERFDGDGDGAVSPSDSLYTDIYIALNKEQA